ncbi:putative amidophosphoribosyltransferase [Streptomyces sp. TLI_235]|nr:hypothetical protein [Streptomyces sp. TLI_235]PBC78923.1 putative amidophosphoribosyltransferase [Streptomyces sp. TLI_235]
MAYKQFTRPNDRSKWYVDDWLEWLKVQDVTPQALPTDEGICALCRQPTKTDALGIHYQRCYECRSYGVYLDGLVPICYSLNAGLEGMIYKAKNEQSASWLAAPLVCLLWKFLDGHRSCLEDRYGGPFEILTTVPSHTETRSGDDHLDSLLKVAPAFYEQWDTGVLTKTASNGAHTRRKEIARDLFVVTPGREVTGKRILLFDDTFTSGGTMASAAYALKQGGARSVVGITLGRQLNADWAPSQALVTQLRGRRLNLDVCPVHEL